MVLIILQEYNNCFVVKVFLIKINPIWCGVEGKSVPNLTPKLEVV